ncbi:MAG: MgtC/SapB family protein [Spirochaetaceae bacterium]|jgi:putative Mg2+ transporter-C (MgtC) family protein|nr:MgtC/SapB family protein [Spirochaetaceae bacterium]
MEELKALFTDPISIRQLTMANALLRILLSFLAGFIIGFVREKRRQPAGLRTHILISVASTLIMIVSITIASNTDSDGSRIASQVVSGIGFLGAGVIIKQGINIRGLTSAAAIWAISAIGLAIGLGMYIPAFTVLAIFVLVLIFIEGFEKRHMPSKRIRQIGLQYNTGGQDIQKIIESLKSVDIIVTEYDLSTSLSTGKTSIQLLVSCREMPSATRLATIFGEAGGLEKLKIISAPDKFGN